MENGKALFRAKRLRKYSIEVRFSDKELIKKVFQLREEQYNQILTKFLEKLNKFLAKHSTKQEVQKKDKKKPLKEQEEQSEE